MDIKVALPLLALVPGVQAQKTKPNVILIITDQQSFDVMSAMGNPWLKTPVMDGLFNSGYSFANSYCAYPVSMASRASLFTGMYPSYYGITGNVSANDLSPDYAGLKRDESNMLANLFNRAGYDTYYGGKSHLTQPGNQNGTPAYGFKNIYTEDTHALLGEEAAKIVSSHKKGDKPFFLVASFINPHDICMWEDYLYFDTQTSKNRKEIRSDEIARVKRYAEMKNKYTPAEWDKICPPLPDNFELTQGPKFALSTWDYAIDEWRLYRWVYYRLAEEVDRDMKPLIEAFNKRTVSDNTYLIFTSDHGEANGSHRRILKTSPYKEVSQVPFIVLGPDVIKKKLDPVNMVNCGIDLLPTVCDLTGIELPKSTPGISLKPVLTGKKTSLDRKFIFVEGNFWNMVVMDCRYKLALGRGDDRLLIDLKKDPLEMNNLSGNLEYKQIEDEMFAVLQASLKERGVSRNAKGLFVYDKVDYSKRPDVKKK